ncbi:hypothetical protein [Burkholderia sp. MSMB1072]|uniref:hypothetical protein n=1 Tax=Burkholderia sp. MSMB1072 TaxID=1637871 RepID=UPI0012E34169|nr:hypothetical protein [Burkholderia sp. MSMB1072]
MVFPLAKCDHVLLTLGETIGARRQWLNRTLGQSARIADIPSSSFVAVGAASGFAAADLARKYDASMEFDGRAARRFPTQICKDHEMIELDMPLWRT